MWQIGIIIQSGFSCCELIFCEPRSNNVLVSDNSRLRKRFLKILLQYSFQDPLSNVIRDRPYTHMQVLKYNPYVFVVVIFISVYICKFTGSQNITTGPEK